MSNGVEMPLLGYGVFQVSPEECERCVSDALSVGYRLIDTAQAYFNEEGVGNAWRKSGIKREDLFLVTKVWISNAGEEKAAKSIDESLRKLQTEYIDLLLIHQAYGDVFGTWRAMEKAYRAGKVRAIGVSNFQAGRFFDFAHYVEVKPMVNQLQCNVMIQQTGIEPIHAEFGTKMMAWVQTRRPITHTGPAVLIACLTKAPESSFGVSYSISVIATVLSFISFSE